ncbi:MAG TPA: TRAP transporter small permease subunit [Methylophilaceae bacterium]|jgi:TRAP-type mannitol/chloroaromatic compound transport system permease small subunit|uniref:TRAP transporter small permease subunit n=1 Tax=uncultured Ferrovibrio sp. TaxID=1576913 RepID=UPI002607C3FC|nr:TRAP transporter small permease subunit [uncultured Ferrovibrio sp.]
MPSLTFTPPHWLYWAVLLLFPLVAQYMVMREKKRGISHGPSLGVAYLFLICSGFAGLHRFYLRSRLGYVFIPVFLAILFVNSQISDSREDVSRTRAAVESSHSAVTRAKNQNVADLSQVEAELARSEAEFKVAQEELAQRRRHSQWLAILMGLMLLGDAILLPRLTRRRREAERGAASTATTIPPIEFHEIGTGQDPARNLHTRVTDAVEWVNIKVGEFVAYWAVIAVFAYFYEVIARYAFNSPTNWVHESMFLMFGMQYMLCGAYAYYEDQHVRVDVLYTRFSVRGKALADIVTSLFFFIFTITLMWTAWRFASDAVSMNEHSFTEWGVQYWPVKLAMPIGAALIVLQGAVKLIKDILIVTRGA